MEYMLCHNTSYMYIFTYIIISRNMMKCLIRIMENHEPNLKNYISNVTIYYVLCRAHYKNKNKLKNITLSPLCSLRSFLGPDPMRLVTCAMHSSFGI